MTKNEFIIKLQEALENDLDAAAVRENVNYYSGYIDDEMRKGRGEEEVLDELGDPWVIAQSVIDMSGQKNVTEDYGNSYRNAGSSSERHQESSYNVHSYTIGSWWQKLLLVLGIIGIVLIVVAVIGGIISLVMPIVVPVLVLILLLKFIRRLKE